MGKTANISRKLVGKTIVKVELRSDLAIDIYFSDGSIFEAYYNYSCLGIDYKPPTDENYKVDLKNIKSLNF